MIPARGWVYDASERTLTLDNYQGRLHVCTTGGNLTIYANGNVVINNESTYHSAIQLWSDDSLDLVVNGTLTINSKSANGIVANGDVTVRSNSLVWTGPDGKTYYDGKGSSLMTINVRRIWHRGRRCECGCQRRGQRYVRRCAQQRFRALWQPGRHQCPQCHSDGRAKQSCCGV